MTTTTPAPIRPTTATRKAPRPVRLAVLLVLVAAAWIAGAYVVSVSVFGAYGAVRMLCAGIVALGHALGTV